MTQLEQKQYLEEVALEFMKLTPESDFKTIADLAKYFNDTYGDDYDWDDVGEWGEDILDAAKKSLGTRTIHTEQYGSSVYNDVYENYTALLMASNFKGHFTARNGRWQLTNADDLQFIFNDKNGTQCVIKLEAQGNVTKVYAFNLDDWYDYDWQRSGNTYIYNEYYDRTQYTIGVPEHVIVTLTQGNTTLIKTTVDVSLTNVSGETLDISKGGFNVSSLTEMHNGYKIQATDVNYTGNKKASSTVTVTKGGTMLVTMSCAGNVNDLPSVNVDAFTSNFDIDDYNTDDANAKDVFVKCDILGKVQMQGKVTDFRKFVDYLNSADDNDDNESQYKSYINQANGLIDINVFYKNTDVKQASVKLEPFVDETWGGHTYWTVEPVMVFYDGSSYSTFEAFFNDNDFKDTIREFKSLANRYADLIDTEIDW